MGAPKQKWTSEEESALKAGVVKHGPGKWSTIVKDPEFAFILRLRSNVDLKDKWRNLQAVANGCGSRQKARPAKSNTQLIDTPECISIVSKEQHDAEMCHQDPPMPVSGTLPSSNSEVKTNPSPLIQGVKQKCCPMSSTKIVTKAEIDAELEKMWSMSPQQAAAMAVKAVAEAEAAIAEAERAEQEAEAAEADANLAKVHVAAAMKALRQTTLCTW